MKNLANLLRQDNLKAIFNPPKRSSSRAECSEETTTELLDLSIKGAQVSENYFFEVCVPKKFAHATLEHCDKQPESFHEYARQWGSNPESVILLGDVGRGKTQFAFAMIREMFRRCNRKLWPRYYTSPEMDAILLKASRDEEADKAIIHQIGSEDLLFIDDFGREIDSQRSKRQYFELL